MTDLWLSGVFLKVNTSKLVFGRGTPWTPLGELTPLPQTSYSRLGRGTDTS